MMKRISTSLLALLLALCMILSACQKGKGSNENQDPTPTPPVSGENGNQNENQNLGACTHAQTALRNAKVASCTAAGYTGDEVCTACGATVRSGSTIAITDHTYDNGRVTKNPTCIEQGWKTFTCSGCGLTKGESIPTVPHQNEYHDMLNGEHQVTCGSCTMSDFDTHVPVDPNGTYHSATCTEDGYTEYVCSLCEAAYRVYSTTDPALNHDWSAWEVTTPNNCVDKGVKSHSCGRAGCGATEELPIPVAPGVHKELAVLRNQAATCQAAGKTVYYCTGCGADDIEVIHDQLPHNLGEPTAAGDGWTHQECENDGCDFKVSTFKATGTSASVSTEQLDEERAFEVETEKANVQFPSEVVSQMTGGSDVKIDAGTVEDKSAAISNATGLTEEEKQHLEKENVEIYDFGVTVDGQPLSQFDGGVTVTIDYKLGDNEDPEGIIIWYIPEGSDQIEKIGDDEDERVTYNAETGKVTFVVKHFSFYAIAYEETQEMKCKRGLHDLAQVGESVVATCYNYGYTVFECNCCHTVEISGVVDMLDHVWSEMIDPQVTCTQGDYAHKVCQNDGCGAVKNFTYQRAEGHKADHVASCTQSSTCTVCNEVLVPAYGHSWSEWSVIVEPTDVKPGLRRRYCPSCGEVEEVKLAATGNVEQLKANSLQELCEAIYAEVLDIDNGKATYVMTEGESGATITVDVTVNRKNTDHLMLVEVVEEYESFAFSGSVLYRNGVVIYTEARNDETPYGSIFDIDLCSIYPYEVMMEGFKQVFDYYMPSVEGSFDEAAKLLEIVDKTLGAEIDEVLAQNGHTITVSHLADVFDSAQRVYLYAALRLGMATTLDTSNGVELPSAEDYRRVLSAFMTATEQNGNTTYTWDATELMAALEDVLAYLEQSGEMLLSDYVWSILGDDVTAAYPDVTDWAGFVAKLKTQIPGTMKVKDAFDKLVTLLEGEGVVIGDDLYEKIDAALLMFAGESINSRELVSAYWDLTLNEMLEAEMGEGVTLESLIDTYAGRMESTTLGESCPAGLLYGEESEDETFSEMLAKYAAMLDGMDVAANISVTLDAAGKLIALDLNEQIDFVQPATPDSPEKRTTFESVQATFVRDDSIVVVVPDSLKPVENLSIESSFDADGNLIIKVPEGVDFEFDLISSSKYRKLGDLIKKDDAVSAEMGYDVYVLDKAFWTAGKEVASYALYNGRYYEINERYVSSYYRFDAWYKLSDVQANPAILLPDTTAEKPIGRYRGENEVWYDVYSTALAPVVKIDGSWKLLKNYDSWYTDYWDGNKYVYFEQFWPGQLIDFEEALSSIELSIMEGYGKTVLKNGAELSLRYGYVWLNVEAFGSETLCVDLYQSAGDDLYLVEWTYVSSDYVRQLGQEVTAPAHDYKSTWTSSNSYHDAAGNELTGVRMVDFYAYVPTYYVKIAGDQYAQLMTDSGNVSSAFTSYVNTTDMETVKLSDGKTLYVLGESEKHAYDGSYDLIRYGYVKLADSLYIQTVAYYKGDALVSHRYRSMVAGKNIYLDDIYELDDYIEDLGNNTYRVPAALLAACKAEWDQPGDYYAVAVSGTLTEGETSYRLFAYAGAYAVADQFSFGGNRADYPEDIWWEELFGYNSSIDFMIVPQKDGTLSLKFRYDYMLNVSYSPSYVPANSVLKAEPEKSQETGLNIYSGVTSHSEGSYIYKDGQYYDWYTVPVLSYTSANSYAWLIANNWRVEDLRLRFQAISDENGNVEQTPVYEGYVSFYSGDYYYSSSCGRTYFFLIRDGKLCVLVGAEEATSDLDPLIKFESVMPAGEYFSALAQTVVQSGSTSYGNEFYLYNQLMQNPNAGRVSYGRDTVTVTEKDSKGNVIQSYELTFSYIMVNGQKIYLKTLTWQDSYLVLDSTPISVGSDWTVRETYNTSYFNGCFKMVTLRMPYRSYYVKLAGSYYHYNEYNWACCSESVMLQNMGQSVVYYAIHVNGKWKYYAQDGFSLDNGYAVLTKPVSNVLLPEWPDYSPQGVQTANGYEVYTVTGYILPDSVKQLKQSDGTVFYYNGELSGYTSGYLKCQDGNFLAAGLVERDGSYTVECSLSRAKLDMELYREKFDKHLVIDKEGCKITISKEILNAVPAAIRDDFVINFGWGTLRLDYADLEGWFELAK